ncbi:hypothetical protein JZN58_004386 [Vibrio vulnificus]|nr:hypothetical protein [Vibrio vulnificus]
MDVFLAFFIPLAYLSGLVSIFIYYKSLTKLVPNLKDALPFLELFTIIFAIVFFYYGYSVEKSNSDTSKKTETIQFFTRIETDKVLEAHERSGAMVKMAITYRAEPKSTFIDPITKRTGDFDYFIWQYINDYSTQLASFRQKSMVCLKNKLCDPDITRELICPNIRAYFYPILTMRKRDYKVCFEKQFPNHVPVNVDSTHDFFIDFCEIDESSLSEFSDNFLRNAGDDFCPS